ncbi:MAG: carbohydrate kinase family protein [Chloroflexota bacterium]|nr:carbohydrate kinase family protein [Chloroflexota bacterium]
MSSKAFTVLSMGDLLLDVTIRYDPLSGETDTGPDGLLIGPGGSAANFAVHAARLGCQTRFVSRVGRDWAGEMLVRSLEGEGVTAQVRATDEATGRVLVMVDPQGNRRMHSYPGASQTLHQDDLDPEWFHNLDAFHLTGYSLLREGPCAAALEALRLARTLGVPFCTLDPNPGHLISSYGPADYWRLLYELQFDALFPNLEEGALLTGKVGHEEIASGLLDLSPVVALTLGDKGCMVAQRSGSLAHVSAYSRNGVGDDTGAGDAFAAGFVVEYLSSRDPVQAARAGNRVAAQVVSRIGAR